MAWTHTWSPLVHPNPTRGRRSKWGGGAFPLSGLDLRSLHARHSRDGMGLRPHYHALRGGDSKGPCLPLPSPTLLRDRTLATTCSGAHTRAANRAKALGLLCGGLWHWGKAPGGKPLGPVGADENAQKVKIVSVQMEARWNAGPPF